ncbi:MAG: DUF4149 domain-containing protein [Betaproteobacteria bacterium]|jgi:hypothetical protein
MNQYICHLLLAACLGIMLFFTVAVAPSIFKILPAEWAAKYVRAFFPKYYLSLGILSLAASFLASEIQNLLLLSTCSTVLFLSYFWLTPTINKARDLGSMRKFHVLHGISVVLNLLVMCFFIWVLIADFKN